MRLSTARRDRRKNCQTAADHDMRMDGHNNAGQNMLLCQNCGLRISQDRLAQMTRAAQIKKTVQTIRSRDD
jgi:hypothetical protein